jgi:hypothetical protein
MIAIESFKKMKIADYGAILVLAALAWGITYAAEALFSPQNSYIISLLTLTALMALTVHLVRKAGAATLFYATTGILTYTLNGVGVKGMDKIIVLITAGIIFELVFLILKVEIKNVEIDILLGTALSAAAIPVTTALLLSRNVAANMLTPLINLSLLSFFTGIAGAAIAFLIWYTIRTTKPILAFEYG